MPPLLVADQLNRIWYRKLLGWKVRFRFFPQCADCSNLQGSIMSQARGVLDRKAITNPFLRWGNGLDLRKLPVLHSKRYNHGLQPRISHLTGTVLGSVAVVNASPDDIQDGCRDRYVGMYRQVSRWFRSVRENDAVVDFLSCLQSRR